MDHIQGLAFFKPLFKKELEVHIWGPGGTTEDLRSHLNRYFSPPLFPAPLRELPCQLHLHEIANSSFAIESFEVTSAFVIHPGPTLGYRIKDGSKIITYIPDHEPMVGSMKLYKKDRWVSGLPLCKNADVLIHDSMYTEEEYLRKVGWGHSSTEHVVQLARRADVKKLFLFHHNPEYSDTFLERRLKGLKQNREETFDILLASEGVEYEV